MKKLVSSTETFGPYTEITVIENGYDCDGLIFQYTVVGECQIEDWVGPLPQPDFSVQNKQQAQVLLSETDWTCTVDINNPQYSNPYLTNQDEFLAYRSTVRAIAVNPPTTPATFPEQPVATWSE
jgi:hypothetical protein